jgi:hypothetical protein
MPGIINPKISDEAVKAKTGKTWKQWFKILDGAGKDADHKMRVALLKQKSDLSPWWQQMVTVTYEQVKGLRKKYEKVEGFQISKTKTINTSVKKVYDAVKEKRVRNRWLKDPGFKLTSSNNNKSIRGKWIDGKSGIEFQFYKKEKDKTQVTVQHSKLKSLREAEKMKKYWEENLNNLKSRLTNK